MWDNFEESKEKLCQDVATKWAKCTIPDCQNPFVKVKNHNTTNLAYHLSHSHGITKKIGENSEDSDLPQDAMLVDFSKADQDQIDSKLYVNQLLTLSLSLSCPSLFIELEFTLLLLRIHH